MGCSCTLVLAQSFVITCWEDADTRRGRDVKVKEVLDGKEEDKEGGKARLN